MDPPADPAQVSWADVMGKSYGKALPFALLRARQRAKSLTYAEEWGPVFRTERYAA